MTISEITVDELAALGTEVCLIDVREPDEYAAGHVPHAELVPLASVPGHLDRFTGSPTYVICRSGARSMNACEFVAAQGRDVVNVAGGTLAWLDAGHAIEAGSGGGAGG